MKKLVICLFVCSLGLALTVGCGGEKKKEAPKTTPAATDKKDEKKEGGH